MVIVITPRGGGVTSIAAGLAGGRGRSPTGLLVMDSDQVTRRPGVEDTDVHPGASVTLGHLGEGPRATGGCNSC